jgi:hypothetical protein
MSRDKTPRRSGKNRTTLYDDITTQIIGDLEAGPAPWVQRWGMAAAKAPLTLPTNAATGRRYSGINIRILLGGDHRAWFSGSELAHLSPCAHLAVLCARANAAPPSSMPIASCPSMRSNKPAGSRVTARHNQHASNNAAILRIFCVVGVVSAENKLGWPWSLRWQR